MTAGGAREQVSRLLTLVPYLHARGQVGVEEAAALLGVTPEQVVRDLKVLFVCGLPGGYPDDLIDVDLDALEGQDADGVIRVSNADYLARPLRLTSGEASAVTVALLAVRSGAPDETREIVDRVLGKLQTASADAPEVAVATDPGDALAALRARLADAVAAGRRLRLTYWVPSRDEETERVVDPRAVVSVRGADYLDAWCHAAQADRLFRLDRIHGVEVLDEEVTHRPGTQRDLAGDLFDFGGHAEPVTLRLAAPAAWVAEYYQVDEARTRPDGDLEVDLPVADRRWLERLVLQLAPHAEVLAPASVHQDVTARAREALRLYASDDVQ